MKINHEWCLRLLDERTHDELGCSANMRGEIINIVSCKQCAYSLEYKLKNLSQDTKDYLGLDYYNKLRALLEGLEIENIEELLRNGDINTYRLIGKMIALKTKELKNEH